MPSPCDWSGYLNSGGMHDLQIPARSGFDYGEPFSTTLLVYAVRFEMIGL